MENNESGRKPKLEQSRVSQYPVSDKLNSIKIRVKVAHVPLRGLTPWGNDIIMRNLQAREVRNKGETHEIC